MKLGDKVFYSRLMGLTPNPPVKAVWLDALDGEQASIRYEVRGDKQTHEIRRRVHIKFLAPIADFVQNSTVGPSTPSD